MQNQDPFLQNEEPLENNPDNSSAFQDKKNKKKDKDAGRGIETMFRTSLRNHITLSQIADSKAHTIFTINSIIISVIISFIFPRLKTDPSLILPTALLILVSISALILSIISTIPKVTRGHVTKEEIHNKTANLLFFGNFHDMSLEDFQWAMMQMLKDKEFLYGAMIRDFYNLGKVLNYKYKLLRLSYAIFMFGLVISILAYTAALIL